MQKKDMHPGQNAEIIRTDWRDAHDGLKVGQIVTIIKPEKWASKIAYKKDHHWIQNSQLKEI